MNTAAEVRNAFTAISTALANAVTAAYDADNPGAALVGHIDQIRAFIDALAATVTDIEPRPAGMASGLDCGICIQDERNAAAAGQTPLPVLPARTLINGVAICDVEGRHRIVTPVQHAVAQSGRLLIPGAGGTVG